MNTISYNYGMWVVAAFNVGIFLFFVISFLAPKGKAEWRNMGVTIAFLVALFGEMYGFPLTIYLLTSWFGEAYPALDPFSHKLGHLWVVALGGSNWAWAAIMALSLALMLGGYLLLSKGWRQIHGTQGELVTNGLYRFVRHPQYTGLFLVIVGFLVQWPTLLTVLMAPLLLYAYARLARKEEAAMFERYGADYSAYAEGVPRFFPPFREWLVFLFSPVPIQTSKGDVQWTDS